jgi:dUTPase
MFKVLDEACEPKRGTKYSAYVDLFAREDVVIGAGETKVVKLGVKLDLEQLYKNILRDYGQVVGYVDEFMNSHYLEVALRSSLAVKGLIIANGIGIIDLDYPDEIGLIVHNPNNINLFKSRDKIDLWVKELKKEFKISKGDKVAQCTLKEHKGFLMGYESDIIRDGGYGSTGK